MVNYVNKKTQKGKVESYKKSKSKVYFMDRYKFDSVNKSPTFNMKS